MTSKPSSTASYALKALVDLALHADNGPVPLKAIAKRQEIPLRYLEQLFHRFGKQRLVEAERGPRGGYRLRRKPADVPVSDIFDCLEERREHPASPVAKEDPAFKLWRQVEAAVNTTLKATTLQDLVAQARDRQPSPFTHPFTFHI